MKVGPKKSVPHSAPSASGKKTEGLAVLNQSKKTVASYMKKIGHDLLGACSHAVTKQAPKIARTVEKATGSKF